MTVDERLLELLVQAEELGEQGAAVTAEELCRDCPELLPELRRLLGGLGQVERLMKGGPAGVSGPTPIRALRPDPDADTPTGVPFSDDVPRAGLPRVAGYELLRDLGRGGMGVVYQAQHRALKRTVALKMILVGAHAGDGERQRFRAEAEAAARLSHPNIVQVYEVGDSDGLPFLALEHVEGQSLAQRLTDGPLAPDEAARLVEALAGAMHLAHSRNVVHRDLKPANVLLAACGVASAAPQAAIPKITDFGLARRLDVATGPTQTGAVVGTPFTCGCPIRSAPFASGPLQLKREARRTDFQSVRLFQGRFENSSRTTIEPQGTAMVCSGLRSARTRRR
jgi:serine/threonine-protein kinase